MTVQSVPAASVVCCDIINFPLLKELEKSQLGGGERLSELDGRLI